MPRKVPPLLWAALPLVWLLYFYHLTAAGMLGPDEPRYASIGREMARSGDWITPRLWGQPWFEKPALLYWMTGAATRLGLGPDLAPRLPVALLAVAFLVFYWWILRREFGARAAWLASLILGTSGLWIGFSQVGATDLPMTVTFSAGMLLALPWAARGERRWLPWSGALFGLAMLAKGLVPLALAAPLAWPAWKYRRDLGRVLAAFGIPFLAVAAPWYVLCYLRNGPHFLIDFFWVQHFERVASDRLAHVQPWWFYLPVAVAALLPWAPLLAVALNRRVVKDPRRLLLAMVAIFGLLLFSVSVNKLPGYVLPLLPALAVLMALGLEESRHGTLLLALCAAQLVWLVAAAPVLPQAIVAGLSHAALPRFHWTWLMPLAAGAAVWFLESRGRRLAAAFCIAASVTAGVAYLKAAVMPQVDRWATARPLAAEVAGRTDQVCAENLPRNWLYGLNYYAGAVVPDCAAEPRPLRIVQSPGVAPHLEAASAAGPVASPVDRPGAHIVTSPFQDANQ
jgi:4-amino-4-deoxy-L-arabinose transferase-like glycosyltransferase